VIQW